MLYAQIRETLQTLPLLFSKTESKMFAEITREEFASHFAITGVTDPGYSFRDQIVESGEIFVAQFAQALSDRFCVGDFRADQP